MDLGLKNKNVIVTGGSGGIGRGLVLEFAREGANVISASRDTKQGALLVDLAKQQQLLLWICTEQQLQQKFRREYAPHA